MFHVDFLNFNMIYSIIARNHHKMCCRELLYVQAIRTIPPQLHFQIEIPG